MSAYVKFNQFVEDLAKKVHNLDSDTLKIMFTNTAPDVVNNKVKADITEIAAGNGYLAGGAQAAFVSGAQTAGTFKLILSQITWTASGGSIGPFRYAVLYNDTPATPLKPLIAYWDYGLALTITSGNQLTAALDQTAGVLTLA